MFHTDTRRLIDYWTSLRRGVEAPARVDFDPARLSDLWPRLFVLGTGGEWLPFRLAGSFLVELYDRELRGDDFARLFDGWARRAVRDAALDAAASARPVVLDAEGRTDRDDDGLKLEIALLPLTGPDGTADRLIGLMQPVSPVARLHGRPLVGMSLRSTAAAEPPRAEPRLRLACVDGRRIA